MHKLYPLKFNSVYKKKIWGGYRLRTIFGRDIPATEKIGESWEIADHGADTTIVKNGPLAGKTLHDIVAENGRELLGRKWACREESQRLLRLTKNVIASEAKQSLCQPRNDSSAEKPIFPLLVKLIDTSETLSVQVHPDDEYAQKYDPHGEQGKMEAWYIIHAEPGARLVYGVIPGTKIDDVKKLLKAGRVEECLNFITVKAGDVIFIPPGMIHAIGAGILLLEVSQNSDLTYRLFDWNRLGEDGKPRPLHVEKALDAIQKPGVGSWELGVTPPFIPPFVRGGQRGGRTQDLRHKARLLDCPKFSLELLEFEKYIEEKNNTNSFHILSFIEGEGNIQYGDNKKDFVSFSKGESILMPASLKGYRILPSNNCRIIKTFVP